MENSKHTDPASPGICRGVRNQKKESLLESKRMTREVTKIMPVKFRVRKKGGEWTTVQTNVGVR